MKKYGTSYGMACDNSFRKEGTPLENGMQKRYGLFTAISMVVGIVIGSGIFFKATKVLANNNGDMGRSLLTVAIVGAIMLICSFVFANLASRYEKVNGVVDYAEAALGRGYAYYVAWFMTLIYYPTLVSCLAWITAQYAGILFGFPITGMTHFWIGLAILVGDGLINAYAPKLAGKLQVSTTAIKLVPLVLMAVVGTIVGLSNGLTVQAFTAASQQIASQGSGLMGAIVAFAFAYEGWIIATSINSELKDAKKNLPLALSLGALIVVAIYMAYFVGLTGTMTTADMMAAGDLLPEKAFGSLFGSAAGTIVFVFIVISCLGTTNGLMMGAARGAYTMGVRNEGIAPRFFAKVDQKTGMATNSAWLGIIICTLWYLYWHFFFIHGMGPSFFNWEPDELPIITLYAAYIPMFISLMVNAREEKPFKRFILPTAAILGCCFMVYCAFAAYRIQALYYLGFFVVVMLIGAVVRSTNNKKAKV